MRIPIRRLRPTFVKVSLFSTWPASITLEVRVRKRCSAVGCKDQYKRWHQPPASEDILMEKPAQQLEKTVVCDNHFTLEGQHKGKSWNKQEFCCRLQESTEKSSWTHLRMSRPSWWTLFLMDVTEMSFFMLELLKLIYRFKIVAWDSSENEQQPCSFILILVILTFFWHVNITWGS